MKIVIKDYLKRLEYEELQRPAAERRRVPSLRELAEAVPLSRMAMYRLVGGQTKFINRDVIESVAKHLRSLGFEPKTTDLIRLDSEA